MSEKTSLPTLPEEFTSTPPRKSKSKWGWVWFLVLVLAAAAAYHFWPKGTNAADGTSTSGGTGGKKGRGGGTTPVVAAKARRGSIGVYVTGLGTVTPLATVTEKALVTGQLMKVNYKEGQLVHEGDELIEIDPRPYQVALDQAIGQQMRDQAMLDNANVDLKRYDLLLQQNAIPEQQRATQKALVDQLVGTVKTDQSAIDGAKLNLVYCHITAQVTGRVGLRLVDPGNIVHSTDTNGLVVITQVQPITVVFPVAEDNLPEVLQRWHAGQQLTAEVWDRADDRKLGTGTLTTVDNQIDPTTGNIRLRLTFPNENEVLFPEQFVNIHLLVQEKQGVTLVPSASIQRTTSTQYVYLVKPDSTVTVRQVTEGTSEGNDTEITNGLQPGDEVVMTGVDRLNEGSKVTVQVQGEGGGRKGQGKGSAPGAAAPSPGASSGGKKGRGGGGGKGQ